MGAKTFYAIILCLIASTMMPAQNIYFVKAGASGDGSSWVFAMGDLQEAIDSCEENDEIWIAEGVYYPTHPNPKLGGGPKNVTYYISKNIKLYGGFQGDETNITQRLPDQYLTILSGDIGIPNNSTDNTSNLIYIDATTSHGPITNSCVLDGLRIVHSRTGIRSLAVGEEASCGPSLRNCYFSNHELAILAFANGGSYDIFQCLFENNGGGVISIGNSGDNPIFIRQCEFVDNDYAISVAEDSIFIDSCYFNNSASTGTAAFSGAGHAYISNCSFENNDAGFNFGEGGAIHYEVDTGMATLEVLNCSFIGNQARVAGAVYLKAGLSGGSLDFALINCNFSSNVGQQSAGVFYAIRMDTSGYLFGDLINCTFANNITNFGHEIIYAVCSRYDKLVIQLTNCILWNENYPEIKQQDCTIKLTNCIIHDTLSFSSSGGCAGCFHDGGNNSYANPLLISGPNVNARLSQASPAIDAGVTDSLPASILTDLDGLPRRNGVVDIGAYENPFVGCQDSILLSSSYSPLQGNYQARKCITLGDQVTIPSSSIVSLRAPEVSFQGQLTSEFGGQLSIDQIGCN